MFIINRQINNLPFDGYSFLLFEGLLKTRCIPGIAFFTFYTVKIETVNMTPSGMSSRACSTDTLMEKDMPNKPLEKEIVKLSHQAY